DVAIEEWQAASPHYAKRMKETLGITGDGVAEIFKGFQLDVGAPPEFMDFRYGVTDHDNGEFWLDHCGALMDVEPMGDGMVKTMCHDIEDPTFPATALATNPRAVVEPIHRPPRTPEGRTPHCHWTVRIDPDVEPAPLPEPAVETASSRIIDFRFAPPAPRDTTGQGKRDDYAGPLLADLVFSEFTSAALVGIIREVYLQMHLVAVGFHQSVRRRSDEGTADRLLAYQSTGIAGVAASRIRDVLDAPGDASAASPLASPGCATGSARRGTRVDWRVGWGCIRPGRRPRGDASAASPLTARGSATCSTRRGTRVDWRLCSICIRSRDRPRTPGTRPRSRPTDASSWSGGTPRQTGSPTRPGCRSWPGTGCVHWKRPRRPSTRTGPWKGSRATDHASRRVWHSATSPPPNPRRSP